MSSAVRIPSAEPLGEMNVTPFIDVMLVLLVMMILTVPIASHKLPVDLPNGAAVPRTDETPHKLYLDAAGRLSWDGQRIADAQLPALLAPMAASETAVLQLQMDPETRYERFDQVLATVKRGGITRLGFVGNDHYAQGF